MRVWSARRFKLVVAADNEARPDESQLVYFISFLDREVISPRLLLLLSALSLWTGQVFPA